MEEVSPEPQVEESGCSRRPEAMHPGDVQRGKKEKRSIPPSTPQDAQGKDRQRRGQENVFGEETRQNSTKCDAWFLR